MLRLFNAFLVLGALASAFVLYSLEHQMRATEREIARPRPRSPKSAKRSSCSMPNGAILTQPARLQALAERPARPQADQADQFVSEDELIARIPSATADQARRAGQGCDRRHSEGDGVRGDERNGRERTAPACRAEPVAADRHGLRRWRSWRSAANSWRSPCCPISAPSRKREHPVESRMPRPDIVDRNGVVLASDVQVPSLFADPRKIIDIDEAVELLTAQYSRSRRQDVARQAAAVEPRLRLAQARDEPGRARRDLQSRHSRHRLRQRDQARLSDGPARRRMCSAMSISIRKASPASRNISTTRARSIPPRSPIPRRQRAISGAALDRHPRAACAGRRDRPGDHQVQGARPAARSCSMSNAAKSSGSSRCPISIRTRRTRTSRPTR